VEAVMDRIKDNVSLDHLSRLLVDVQSDSSSIVDAIISQYQRDLLQLVFLGTSHPSVRPSACFRATNECVLLYTQEDCNLFPGCHYIACVELFF
jgi:hypothetical protein